MKKASLLVLCCMAALLFAAPALVQAEPKTVLVTYDISTSMFTTNTEGMPRNQRRADAFLSVGEFKALAEMVAELLANGDPLQQARYINMRNGSFLKPHMNTSSQYPPPYWKAGDRLVFAVYDSTLTVRTDERSLQNASQVRNLVMENAPYPRGLDDSQKNILDPGSAVTQAFKKTFPGNASIHTLAEAEAWTLYERKRDDGDKLAEVIWIMVSDEDHDTTRSQDDHVTSAQAAEKTARIKERFQGAYDSQHLFRAFVGERIFLTVHSIGPRWDVIGLENIINRMIAENEQRIKELIEQLTEMGDSAGEARAFEEQLEALKRQMDEDRTRGLVELDEIKNNLEEMKQHITKILAGFADNKNALQKTFDALSARFDAVRKKIDEAGNTSALETRLISIEESFKSIKTELDSKEFFDEVASEELKKRMLKLETEIENVEKAGRPGELLAIQINEITYKDRDVPVPLRFGRQEGDSNLHNRLITLLPLKFTSKDYAVNSASVEFLDNQGLILPGMKAVGAPDSPTVTGSPMILTMPFNEDFKKKARKARLHVEYKVTAPQIPPNEASRSQEWDFDVKHSISPLYFLLPILLIVLAIILWMVSQMFKKSDSDSEDADPENKGGKEGDETGTGLVSATRVRLLDGNGNERELSEGEVMIFDNTGNLFGNATLWDMNCPDQKLELTGGRLLLNEEPFSRDIPKIVELKHDDGTKIRLKVKKL